MAEQVDGWISDLARRRGWQIMRPLRDGGAEIAGATPDGLRWTCRADPVQADRVRPVPAVEYRCRDVSADDVLWLVVHREQSPGVTATSSDIAGDLGILAIGALAWLLRRGTRAARTEQPSVRGTEAGSATPPPSIMGAGWHIDDPAEIVDARTAAVLLGATVVPGGATIAVHLNQHGMVVTSGGWWDDAARLEHLIDCGVLLSTRARALGARPSTRT
ncbi:MAG: hypothetical protein WAL50_06255 [Kineosporiaceae bacterium]